MNVMNNVDLNAWFLIWPRLKENITRVKREKKSITFTHTVTDLKHFYRKDQTKKSNVLAEIGKKEDDGAVNCVRAICKDLMGIKA